MSREPWWHFLHKEEAGKVYFLLVFLFITSNDRESASSQLGNDFIVSCIAVVITAREVTGYTQNLFTWAPLQSWYRDLLLALYPYHSGTPNCNYDLLTYSNLFTWTSPYRYPSPLFSNGADLKVHAWPSTEIVKIVAHIYL